MFDFDDTLVESEAIKDGIFKNIFAQFPAVADAAWEFHRQNGSKPRAEKFAWLAAHAYPRDENRQKNCLDDCLKKFNERSREEVAAAPEVRGATALLSALAGKIPLYVASLNPQEELEFQIRSRKWGRYFQACFGNPPLPKTEALRAVAVRQKLEFREILLIGDSLGDQEAAKKVGTSFWMRKKGRQQGYWMDGSDLQQKLGTCAGL